MFWTPDTPLKIDTEGVKRGFKSSVPLPQGQFQRYGVKIFLILASSKTRSNGHELRFGRFGLDKRENTFPGKMVQVRTGHQRGGRDLCPQEEGMSKYMFV